MIKKLSGLLLAILVGASAVLAQDAQVRSLTSGQKYKIKGAVVSKDEVTMRSPPGLKAASVTPPSWRKIKVWRCANSAL